MKSLGVAIAAFLVAVVGFFGAKFMIGTTAFAAQAGTLGSVIALVGFFGAFFSMVRIADDFDMKSKVNAIKPQSSSSTKTRDERQLAALAKAAQKSLRIDSNTHIPKIRNLMTAAGWFGDRAIYILIIVQVVMAIAGLAVAPILFIYGFEPAIAILVGMGAMALGFYGPILIVRQVAKARQGRLFVEFPDALDLIVIYVECGNTFDTAVSRVVDTLAHRYPTVTSELKLLEYELRYFTDRSIALDNMARRCNIDMVKRLSSIIEQSEVIGSPVAESLKILAKDSRTERFLAAEARAAKIPVIMQIPMILFILPSLFVFVLGPTVIKVVVTFSEIFH